MPPKKLQFFVNGCVNNMCIAQVDILFKLTKLHDLVTNNCYVVYTCSKEFLNECMKLLILMCAEKNLEKLV